MDEFTLLVSKTIKHQWTFTTKADSFEDAEREALAHAKHGEMPRGADISRVTINAIPVVSGVELEPCWWQKVARKKVEGKTEAIFDAYCTLADLRDRSVSGGEMLAAALREVINQCQNGQGMISAPELLRIATELDVAEDDIELFQAQ